MLPERESVLDELEAFDLESEQARPHLQCVEAIEIESRVRDPPDVVALYWVVEQSAAVERVLADGEEHSIGLSDGRLHAADRNAVEELISSLQEVPLLRLKKLQAAVYDAETRPDQHTSLFVSWFAACASMRPQVSSAVLLVYEILKVLGISVIITNVAIIIIIAKVVNLTPIEATIAKFRRNPRPSGSLKS